MSTIITIIEFALRTTAMIKVFGRRVEYLLGLSEVVFDLSFHVWNLVLQLELIQWR